MTQEREADERKDGTDGQALSVLRGIWTAQRQSAADIESAPGTKVCKNMKNIGFGGLAGDSGPGGGVEGDSTAGPVGEDLRSAWRDRLAREGKIPAGSVSLRDLVMGAEPPGSDGSQT